ncbi:beta-glucosidase BglX [Rhizosphaericola mali]|uniref:Periplasmic beta-glucosidase n=1 Tax=Rhizosphaericola mali TaxID=2545455 RepID=A0A5P2G8R0_9BACT|nr:beta-glucosidase BglX [Rhizosphaericola mali]QES89603.1 beta-glucosidase BglX [Rhizosphaericola mali]
MRLKQWIVLSSIVGCVSSLNAQQNEMNKFVSNLMSKMTTDEKIGQLNQEAVSDGVLTGSIVQGGVDEKIKKGQVGSTFGIWGASKLRRLQEMAVNNSRLHIPLLFGLDVIHGHRTLFPIPLGISTSWDLNLIQQSAHYAAKEATADGLKWVFSPMVDIARDPRWGRVSEGSGEDPYLGSLIAKAMIKGYQGNSLADTMNVLACIKHFALYGGAEAGREYNTVDMSLIKMYEYYFPPYKAAVDAGAASVMTSFNDLNGVPSTANRWLLTDVLRKQWGFNGLVVTDYTAVSELIAHGIGKDLQEVSAKSLAAGTDMDMVSEGFLNTLGKSLKEGKITIAQIDSACKRVLEAKYKAGLFKNPYAGLDSNRYEKEILTKENRAFARKLASHSMVLLKNENQILPLQKKGTIALVGPLADSRRNMLGTWSVSGEWDKAVTVKEGIENAVDGKAKIIYAKGANISDDTLFNQKVNVFGEEISIDEKSPETLIKEAVDAANNSDVVVAVVGEAADMTGESSSRSHIDIPESQAKLLRALVATGKPVVAVLFNGRPLTLDWEKEHLTGILDAWFGGTEGGNAIADILFGDYNPSGKLTMTFPRNVGQIPIYYNHKNTGRPYVEGGPTKFKSDYLDVPNTPLYPFGYGLSYTTFAYDAPTISNTHPKGNAPVKLSVKVSNTGKYAGEETVQLYISDPVASVTRSVEDLKGFQKVYLNPGESKVVNFIIDTESLKFYNANLKYDWEPGEFTFRVGTNSEDTKAVTVHWDK